MPLYMSPSDAYYYPGDESQDAQNHFYGHWAPGDIQDDPDAAVIHDAATQSSLIFNPPPPDEPILQYHFHGRFDHAEPRDHGLVCYGMLHRVYIKLTDKNHISSVLELQHSEQATGTQRLITFSVAKQQSNLSLLLSDDRSVGVLSQAMFKSLDPLMQSGTGFFLESVIPVEVLRHEMTKMSKSASDIIRIDINVYGLRDEAKRIGVHLSDNRLWLQRPDHSRHDLLYENPHVVSFPGINMFLPTADEVPSTPDEEDPLATPERIQMIVSDIHGSLQRASELETTASDRRVKTPLQVHQQRALTFMKQRESGNIPEKYRLWRKSTDGNEEKYTHRITGAESALPPQEKGGGILADEMGMGKSLCVLALLLDTLDDGDKWARQKHNDESYSDKSRVPSRSTLVVVPSELLIENWINEIKAHLDGNLKWIKYHGTRRNKDPNFIADSDFIVTTYQTLYCEYASGQRNLHKIEWYRVVLDEAHFIRRPSSKLHRMCSDLEANSRWCLTGTPIQNQLLDIGALFSFIRAEPFHEISQFRRLIAGPFDQLSLKDISKEDRREKYQKVKDSLVWLYESLCLRRSRDILDLPGVDDQERSLEFSQEERIRYNETLETLQRTVSEKVGQYEKNREFGIFQAQLQLRILCNHGTYQKPFSWKIARLQLDQSLSVGLGTAFEGRCDGCEQPRPAFIQTPTSCGHFVCIHCIEHMGSIPGFEDSIVCPSCYYKNFRESVQTESIPERNAAYRGHHRDSKMYFHDQGSSIKMTTLVMDLKGCMGEVKSIVFTCWTYTLDLVGRHLENSGIDYLRIDGDTPMKRRQRVLEEFDTDSGASVLLATTGTGALGLNITAASRVFILEPQWNPSVENQAIARTTRLNQKETVSVIRYRINNTVETQMISQQKRKREMARMGW